MPKKQKYKRIRFHTLRHILNMPFILGIAIPLVIIDICAEIYHQVGFRLIGIPLVKRSKYVKMDRQKLKYLSFTEKINCAYCGYANGVVLYFGEIAARTEMYFCGIMHKKKKDYVPTRYHRDFLKYGDGAAWRDSIKMGDDEAFQRRWDKHIAREKREEARRERQLHQRTKKNMNHKKRKKVRKKRK